MEENKLLNELIQDEAEENIIESSEISIDSFDKTLVLPMDLSVEIIISWYKSKKLALNPSFQRRYVWNDVIKSVFIESLMLNVPIPSILLANNSDENKFIVIDGKQRLNAIISFIAPEKNGKGFKLKGLKVLKELNGYDYKKLQSDLSKTNYLNKIENAILKTNVLKNYNIDILYFIFNRLNSGSIPLSPQELRQSLYAGNFIDFVNEYSIKSPGIQKVLNLKTPDKRMRDAELLVRYFAFKYFYKEYNGNINNFFNTTCDKLNKAWDSNKNKVINDAKELEEAINFVYLYCQEDAFKVYFIRDDEEFFGPFNRPMFDLLTSVFSVPENRKLIEDKNIDLKAFLITLFKTNTKFSEAFLPTTHSKEKTNTRMNEFKKALKG